MKKNYEQVVTRLENNNFSSTYVEGANKAQGYVKKLQILILLFFFHFMLDFQPEVANLSKAFQSETLSFCEVTILVDGTILALAALKTNNGKKYARFL